MEQSKIGRGFLTPLYWVPIEEPPHDAHVQAYWKKFHDFTDIKPLPNIAILGDLPYTNPHYVAAAQLGLNPIEPVDVIDVEAKIVVEPKLLENKDE